MLNLALTALNTSSVDNTSAPTPLQIALSLQLLSFSMFKHLCLFEYFFLSSYASKEKMLGHFIFGPLTIEILEKKNSPSSIGSGWFKSMSFIIFLLKDQVN